jgi:uncharacterized membrane protein HdeD (DUF308 family)
MNIMMTRNWWVYVTRGIVAILFGLMALLRPNITLVALVYLFAFYALVDGVMNCTTAFMHRGERYITWLLVEGIFGIALGIIAFSIPTLVAETILIFIGAWLLIVGIFRIVTALELRRQLTHDWLYVVSGVLSALVGAITLFHPGLSAIAWVWVLGAYAFVAGIVLVTIGMRLRGSGQRSLPTSNTVTPL